MKPINLEIKRVRIRSIVRVVFIFHLLVGLFLGLIVAVGWGVISIFGMYELVPSFLGDMGNPDTSSLLIAIAVTSLALGVLGVLIWALLALLYNVIAGVVGGVRFEVVGSENENESKKEGDG